MCDRCRHTYSPSQASSGEKELPPAIDRDSLNLDLNVLFIAGFDLADDFRIALYPHARFGKAPCRLRTDDTHAVMYTDCIAFIGVADPSQAPFVMVGLKPEYQGQPIVALLDGDTARCDLLALIIVVAGEGQLRLVF